MNVNLVSDHDLAMSPDRRYVAAVVARDVSASYHVYDFLAGRVMLNRTRSLPMAKNPALTRRVRVAIGFDPTSRTTYFVFGVVYYESIHNLDMLSFNVYPVNDTSEPDGPTTMIDFTALNGSNATSFDIAFDDESNAKDISGIVVGDLPGGSIKGFRFPIASMNSSFAEYPVFPTAYAGGPLMTRATVVMASNPPRGAVFTYAHANAALSSASILGYNAGNMIQTDFIKTVNNLAKADGNLAIEIVSAKFFDGALFFASHNTMTGGEQSMIYFYPPDDYLNLTGYCNFYQRSLSQVTPFLVTGPRVPKPIICMSFTLGPPDTLSGHGGCFDVTDPYGCVNVENYTINTTTNYSTIMTSVLGPNGAWYLLNRQLDFLLISQLTRIVGIVCLPKSSTRTLQI